MTRRNRRHRRWILLPAALLAASIAGAAHAGTVFSYDSQPGDFIGGGGSATWTDADGDWDVERNFDNGAGFFFTEDGGPSFWLLDFAAPDEVEITPGFYDNAQRFPFQDPGTPGMDVSGEGRGCGSLNSDFSEFTVSEIVYDWYGLPVRFSATFEQRCSSSSGSLFGSIDHEFGVIGPMSLGSDNLLVTIENKMYEYTPAGARVKAIPILESDGTPPGSSDQAKDLVVNAAGGVHVTHGLFNEGVVHTLDPPTGDWRHDTFANWENSSASGIATFGDFVFVNEGFSPGGIVRFDTANDFAGTRFADDGTTYWDLAAGLDGRLYALRSNSPRDLINIFDPTTLASLGSVNLDQPVDAIAVDAAGQIFAVDNQDLIRFDAAGVTQDTLLIGENLVDVDVARDGRVVAGGSSNLVVVTDAGLGSFTSFPILDSTDSSLFPTTYVAFVQLPPDPIFMGNGFESGDTSGWTGAVGETAGFLDVNESAARSGAFGLEVLVGAACPFDPDLLVEPPPDTISGEFYACDSLTAQGVEVIAPGGEFRAGGSIAMGSGFSVASDAPFQAVLDPSFATGVAYVEDATPAAEQRYHARFDLNLDSLALGDADLLHHLEGYSADGELQLRLTLKRNVPMAENRLVVAARLNDGSFAETPAGQEIMIPAGWSTIELDWKAGAGDGKLVIYVDDVFFGGVTGLTNDLSRVDTVRWGQLGGSLGASSGSLLQDVFTSWR